MSGPRPPRQSSIISPVPRERAFVPPLAVVNAIQMKHETIVTSRPHAVATMSAPSILMKRSARAARPDKPHAFMENSFPPPFAAPWPLDEHGYPWTFHLAEARLALSARVNLMLIGPEGQVASLLDAIHPELVAPTASWQPGNPLVLPPVGTLGTLVLHDVGRLTLPEQRRLLEWLSDSVRRVQVISTTPSSIVPLLESGAFLTELHYRLNVVCVDLKT